MAWRDNTDPTNPACVGACVAFIPRLWLKATEDMSDHCDRVQGFLYEDQELNAIVHVVRDLNLPPSHQEVFRIAQDTSKAQDSPQAAADEYERCHQAMLDEIEVHRYHITWAHYRERIVSGAYTLEDTKGPDDE